MIFFENLNKEEQNNLRRQYKLKYRKEYTYSIRLFILQCILGVFSLLGVFLACFYSLNEGMLIFLTCFILMIIVVYFLDVSNEVFYKFLRENNIYNKKK